MTQAPKAAIRKEDAITNKELLQAAKKLGLLSKLRKAATKERIINPKVTKSIIRTFTDMLRRQHRCAAYTTKTGKIYFVTEEVIKTTWPFKRRGHALGAKLAKKEVPTA